MSLNNGFINSTIICNEKKEVDLDALNLLATGEMTELCPCAYKNENRHHLFIYNTNGLISLTQLQAGISFEEVIGILASAVNMLQYLAEKNLPLDNIKNAKEYVFRADGGYRFVYIPIVHKPSLSRKDYLLKLISVIHYKDVRLVQFVKNLRKQKTDDQVLAYLMSFVSSYTLNSYQFFDEGATSLLSPDSATLMGDANGAPTYMGAPESAPYVGDEGGTTLLSSNAAPSYMNAPEAAPAYMGAPESAPYVGDEGGTTVLSQENYTDDFGSLFTIDGTSKLTEYYHDESSEYETTVLTSQPVIPSQPVNQGIDSEYSLCLIRSLNGEKITVDMTPFTIGKDSANMDYVLNNDSVSRHHATIIYEDGDYFIMDNNSTNGTTIEGIRLQPNEKCEIGHGYLISLGSESFQAHIERR